MSRPTVRHSGKSLVDLVAALFVCTICGGLVLAADRVADERQRRIACAKNLHRFGQAMLMYANENKGVFPRTQYDRKAADTARSFTGAKAADPFGEDGPEANDVTAGLYLLVRAGNVTPGAFVCPSTDDKPNPTDPQAGGNFVAPAHLSYSYANPYVGEAGLPRGLRLNYTLAADFAIAADLNPGGAALPKAKPADLPPAGGTRAVDPAAFAKAVTEATKRVNSPNHGGWGQNVLYADGHVEWQPTPFCGADRTGERDNLFSRHLPPDAPREMDPISGSGMDQFDSVLLPDAAALKKTVVSAAPAEPADGNAGGVDPAREHEGL